MKARYRKINDRSQNSSTYHKKDGANVRAKLKAQALKDLLRHHVEAAIARGEGPITEVRGMILQDIVDKCLQDQSFFYKHQFVAKDTGEKLVALGQEYIFLLKKQGLVQSRQRIASQPYRLFIVSEEK